MIIEVPMGEESREPIIPFPEFDRLDWELSIVETKDIELTFSFIILISEFFLKTLMSVDFWYTYRDSGIRTIELAFMTLSTVIFLEGRVDCWAGNINDCFNENCIRGTVFS